MILIQSIKANWDDWITLLQQLTDEKYYSTVEQLSGSSIGEHTRHSIEMLDCLLSQYDSGCISYDLRDRNKELEIKTDLAIQKITELKKQLEKPNKKLILKQKLENNIIEVESNYYRELLYNFEHCIHHQALVKVAVINEKNLTLSSNFGIAPSTFEYKNKCVQ